MRKKVLTLVVAVATLALSAAMLAGCTGGSQQSGDSSATDGSFTLKFGFDQSYPPYGYVGDDGQFTGFDVDLAKAVCEKTGWKLQLEPIDWNAKDALIESGAVNCIWNGFTVEGREDKYTFSDAYMYNEQTVVVKAGSDMKNLDDLKGKIVLTQTGSAALHLFEDGGSQKALADTFKELQTIGDYNNAFMQLESGMVDAVACDLSIASYQMAAKPDAYVKLGALASEHYAVGFKKGDTELAKQVSDALKKLDEEGFVKELCAKYADQGISYDNWVL